MEPLRGIFLQAVPHNSFQAGWNVARGFGKLGHFFLQNGAHGVGGGFAVESPLAGDHLVQNCAEGKDIRALVGGLTSHLLRGHVTDRAHDQPRLVTAWRVGASAPPEDSGMISLARPKSRIFTRPSLVMNRFSGFRSRCTMPFSCAAASPRATCNA